MKKIEKLNLENDADINQSLDIVITKSFIDCSVTMYESNLLRGKNAPYNI